MEILLENAGKKFVRKWLFKNLQYIFEENKSYAITGSNGAGKSTLLQIVLGINSLSDGKIKYMVNGLEIEKEKSISQIAFASPYMELIEEYTALEYLSFYFSLKKILYSEKEILSMLTEAGLKNFEEKEIRNFSSGMKQRIRLIACFYANTAVILLDEPTTNLDKQGIAWYLANIARLKNKKSIIIASNMEEEYSFCDEILTISY